MTNGIYVGDTVQGKTKKINYKIKKVVKNKQNDFIIVENTHEAIIDRDLLIMYKHFYLKMSKGQKRKDFTY